jgi:hypothetical protein
VGEPNLRSAISEHLGAYAEVATSSSRQWASQLAYRVVMFLVVGTSAFLAFVIGSFVAILVSWNTPYRWWVAGGILVLCIAGVIGGLVAASRALRTAVAPPWTILADQVATDLRGRHGEPGPEGNDPATLRLQHSRAQLREMMPGRAAGAVGGPGGGGTKIGLGIVALLLTTLFRRKARTLGGAGLALSLALAALRLFRQRK